MWPDRVSNPGLLTYESGALPTALCGPAICNQSSYESLWENGKKIYVNELDHMTKMATMPIYS